MQSLAWDDFHRAAEAIEAGAAAARRALPRIRRLLQENALRPIAHVNLSAEAPVSMSNAAVRAELWLEEVAT